MDFDEWRPMDDIIELTLDNIYVYLLIIADVQ